MGAVMQFRRELTQEDLERMRVPRRYWEVRFQELTDDDGAGPNGESTREMIGRYLSRIDKAVADGAGMILYGPNGSGKTSAAVVIAKEFRRRGHPVLFLEAADMKRIAISKEQFDEDETYWQRATSVAVLIVDDFGKGVVDETGFGAALVDELIRARNARQLVTLITTNTRPRFFEEELRIKPSTVHTMKECMVGLEMKGRDRRDDAAESLGRLLHG